MITVLDTTTPGAIGRLASTSSDALAGYNDGLYNDIRQLEAMYPGHRHQAIAVFPWDDGDWLDIETGDARPQDAPGWVRRQHARGLARPGLYASLSVMPAVHAALEAAGIARNSVRLIYAAYASPPDPTILPGYDGHQYTDHWQGRNVDASVVRDDFFDVALVPHRPRRRRRPTLHRRHRPRQPRRPVHRKVKGAASGGISGVALAGLLATLGVHLNPPEAAALATLLAGGFGYLTPLRAHT